MNWKKLCNEVCTCKENCEAVFTNWCCAVPVDLQEVLPVHLTLMK